MANLRLSVEAFRAIVQTTTARGFQLRPRYDDPAVGEVPLGDRSIRLKLREILGPHDLPYCLLVNRSDWEGFGGGVRGDFAGLVEALRNLEQVPDAAAQTRLTEAVFCTGI